MPNVLVMTSTKEALTAAAARAYEAAHGNPIPEAARGVRVAISGRAAVSAVVMVVLIVAVAVYQARPSAAIVPEVAFAVQTTSSASMTVHVAGQVQSPGVYELEGQPRLVDAIEAAGGATSDARLDAVNLARFLSDGEQVVVPALGDVAGSAGGGKVNINTADAAALETLPGIGPVLAARIVADREAHGPYVTVDDLGRVSGVGPSILSSLGEAATV